MHSLALRWDLRECTEAYFGFCACIPLARIAGELLQLCDDFMPRLPGTSNLPDLKYPRETPGNF